MSGSVGAFRKEALPLEFIRRMLHRFRLWKISSLHSAVVVNGHPIFIAKNCDIRAPHSLKLGNYVSFGKNFTCEIDLIVGDHVLISSNVSIVGKDHPFDNREVTIVEQERNDDGIVEIGSDVLIGFGSIIVGSVKIGDGCIVGAGSVITRDLPPYTICVGTPARPIRNRYPS